MSEERARYNLIAERVRAGELPPEALAAVPKPKTSNAGTIADTFTRCLRAYYGGNAHLQVLRMHNGDWSVELHIRKGTERGSFVTVSVNPKLAQCFVDVARAWADRFRPSEVDGVHSLGDALLNELRDLLSAP